MATQTAGAVVRVSGAVGAPDGEVVAAATAAATDITVLPVGPTGLDALSPLVTATVDGTTRFYEACSPAAARAVVEAAEAGDLASTDADAVVEHDPETDSFSPPEDGPLTVGRRRVTADCGWVAPADASVLEGGAVAAAELEPRAVLSDVEDLGLRGRGRGDGATDVAVAPTWRAVRAGDGDPVVVVNGNEADPAADGDQLLLESAPLAVLDGALAVRHVVGATDVVVYLNEAQTVARERVEDAVAALAAADVDPEASVSVVAGPDQYTAGEPTMALEAMEGNDRLEARRRPPGPEEYGLYGRPTAVHTPRTLAQVRAAVRHPDWFDPDAADPGTRLVTIARGDGALATVELRTDGSLGDGLAALGAREFKMATVGGRFGGLTRDLDVPPGASALRAARLGTNGAVELFGDDRCAVALAGRQARFAREENCGRCVPCREGSKQLTDMLRAVYDGSYEPGRLTELTRVLRESSVCEFGRDAARPVETAIDAFESEFAAHADGRCPSGECDR